MTDLTLLNTLIPAFQSLPITKILLLILAYQIWMQQKDHRARYQELSEAIRKWVWKTILENKQLMQIASDAVKWKSLDKLSFIRDLLNEEDLYTRPKIYEKRIASELTKQSNEYYLKLNQYILPWGKLLWDWTDENFQSYAKDFMGKIYKVVFDNWLSVEKKVSAIESVMMEVQNNLWEDLKAYLNNK